MGRTTGELERGANHCRLLPARLSIKNVIAHLRAWQQISVARMEAAAQNTEPKFPDWPAGLETESKDGPDKANAWIYQAYRERPWTSVHRDWREGFLRFVTLGEAIPERDMLDAKKYSWLEGWPLIDVLQHSYAYHHEEHFEPLPAWLRQHEPAKTARCEATQNRPTPSQRF